MSGAYSLRVEGRSSAVEHPAHNRSGPGSNPGAPIERSDPQSVAVQSTNVPRGLDAALHAWERRGDRGCASAGVAWSNTRTGDAVGYRSVVVGLVLRVARWHCAVCARDARVHRCFRPGGVGGRACQLGASSDGPGGLPLGAERCAAADRAWGRARHEDSRCDWSRRSRAGSRAGAEGCGSDGRSARVARSHRWTRLDGHLMGCPNRAWCCLGSWRKAKPCASARAQRRIHARANQLRRSGRSHH